MTTSIKYSVHQCCVVKEYLGVNRLIRIEREAIMHKPTHLNHNLDT